MPLPRFATAATALLAALFLPAAHAQVTGSVQVNWQSLVITVTDTNPVDGIQAGFQWDWQQTAGSSFVDGIGFLPESSLHDDWTSSGGFAAVRASFSTQGAYDAETLFVTSSANGGPQVASRVYRQGRMLFIGEGRVDASLAMQAQVAAGPGQQAAWAYADANLLFADSSWNALSAVDYARADLSNGGSVATTLTATLNFRQGDAAQLLTQPGVVLQPVPEPGAWALLAGGLAALAVWRPRSAQRARRA